MNKDQDPYSYWMESLDWEVLIPPLRAAVRCTSGLDMREYHAASVELVEIIRKTTRDHAVRVIEQNWHESTSGPMKVLFERDRVTWDMVQESIQRWEYSQWLKHGSDSDIAFLGTETSIYLTISPDSPTFWIAIPADYEGREELLDSVRITSCAEEQETALFEWGYLTHYEQEVVYGGDWRNYKARGAK